MPKASDCTIQDLLDAAGRVNRKKIPEYCGIKNCARPYRALNLCWTHYIRLYKWRKSNAWKLEQYDFQDMTPFVQSFKGQYRIDVRELFCHVPDCKSAYHARGLCRSHYLMWWKQVHREEA
jgi:hypothetical protein